MILYKGYLNRTKEGGFTVFKNENGNRKQLSPIPSQKLRNHSPDGFAWGYGGSGPAQLALALLLDTTKEEDTASANYQNFKWKIVAGWKMDEPWEFTSKQIEDWLINER